MALPEPVTPRMSIQDSGVLEVVLGRPRGRVYEDLPENPWEKEASPPQTSTSGKRAQRFSASVTLKREGKGPREGLYSVGAEFL